MAVTGDTKVLVSVGRVQPFHFLPYFTLVIGQVRNVCTPDFYLHILKNIVHVITPI